MISSAFVRITDREATPPKPRLPNVAKVRKTVLHRQKLDQHRVVQATSWSTQHSVEHPQDQTACLAGVRVSQRNSDTNPEDVLIFLVLRAVGLALLDARPCNESTNQQAFQQCMSHTRPDTAPRPHHTQES
jgi:hypothetical protein